MSHSRKPIPQDLNLDDELLDDVDTQVSACPSYSSA